MERARKTAKKNPDNNVYMNCDPTYMGPEFERYSQLADAKVVIKVEGQEIELPVHSSDLAKHSNLILEALLSHKQQPESEPLVLRAPFDGKSLGGVKLFLACCYRPDKSAIFMERDLEAQPSGEWVRDAWVLAHMANAQELFESMVAYLLSIVPELEGSLIPWMEAADECEAQGVREELVNRQGKLLSRMQNQEELGAAVQELLQLRLSTVGGILQAGFAAPKKVQVLGEVNERMVEWDTDAFSNPRYEGPEDALSPTFRVGKHTWRLRLAQSPEQAAEGSFGMCAEVQLRGLDTVRVRVYIALQSWSGESDIMARGTGKLVELHREVPGGGWGRTVWQSFNVGSRLKDPNSGILQDGLAKIGGLVVIEQ